MKDSFSHYRQAVKYLDGFANLPGAYPHDGKQPSRYIEYLKRTQYFFDLIGNPHKSIKAIHVAGTSGKGSTSANIQSILTTAGFTAGLFTTPYATSFTEEFKVGDQYIAPNELADIIDYLKPFVDEAYAKSPYGGPSHFEIKTAIALIYFARQKCDYIVLEVGLGGEFDATNAKTNKVASVITNVGLDHTDILGNKLEIIARAKAGIIKPKVPVFTTAKDSKVLEVIYKIANKNKAPLTVVNSTNPNQDLASAVCAHLGIDKKDIQRGLKNMFIPARFERILKTDIIIDGAHNPDKIKYLVEKIKKEKEKYNHLTLIFGAAQDKPAIKMLELLHPIADEILFTKFSNPFRKAWSPHELMKKLHKKVNRKKNQDAAFLDPIDALYDSFLYHQVGDLTLITGSFFLAGELRARYYSEEHILKTRRPR